ncbi:unnamed protein product [Paramecium sonneborni]|uniref:Transmembrane protein n=1 Tax=Paramecium sonneborni TaxID=65129 RepID=A0A8S1KMK5_9CILI|nr:unnamed protein product [Paramecium sonneborni]
MILIKKKNQQRVQIIKIQLIFLCLIFGIYKLCADKLNQCEQAIVCHVSRQFMFKLSILMSNQSIGHLITQKQRNILEIIKTL